MQQDILIFYFIIVSAPFQQPNMPNKKKPHDFVIKKNTIPNEESDNIVLKAIVVNSGGSLDAMEAETMIKGDLGFIRFSNPRIVLSIVQSFHPQIQPIKFGVVWQKGHTFYLNFPNREPAAVSNPYCQTLQDHIMCEVH